MEQNTSNIHKSGIRLTELKEQIENYDSIPFWKSARGVSVYLMLFSLFISLVRVIQSGQGQAGFIVMAVVFGPLSYFFYRGRIWSMILAFAAWTVLILYKLIVTADVTQIILWTIFAVVFYRAIVVEHYRRKVLKGQFAIEQLSQEAPKPYWLGTLTATFTGFVLILVVPLLFIGYVTINWSTGLGWIVYLIYVFLSILFIRFIYKAINRRADSRMQA